MSLAQDALEHRRHAHKERDGTSLVRVECHLRIELRQQHLGGSLTHRGAQEECQAEGVEVGE